MYTMSFVTEGIISSELHTEWKTFCYLLAKQLKDNLKLQLKDLVTNKMLITSLPNLHILAKICLSLPVGRASVETSFAMKLIKFLEEVTKGNIACHT